MAKLGGPMREGSVTDPWLMSPRNKQEENKTPQKAEEKENSEEKGDVQLKLPENENQNNDATSKNEIKSPSENVESNNTETSENDPNIVEQEVAVTLNNGNGQSSDQPGLPKEATMTLNEDQPTVVENTGLNSEENISVDDESEYYDPELIITEEEAREFEEMLAKRKEDLVNQKLKFEKWTDGITRRRMFALSRLRKLGLCQKKRINFYKQMSNFVVETGETFKNIIDSKNGEIKHNKSKADTSTVPKNVEPEPTMTVSSSEGIGARELTGFVMKSDTSDVINKTEQNVTQKNAVSNDDLSKSEQNITQKNADSSNPVENTEQENQKVEVASKQEASPLIVPVES